MKAGFTEVVTANSEVLFSSGFLDLSAEPMVVSIPDMGSRFWIAQLEDWWSDNLDSVGSRATGTKAQSFALVGPNWTGTLPAGMTKRQFQTNNAWLLIRFRVKSSDPNDVAAAEQLQDQIDVRPLSKFGTDWKPPVKVEVRPPIGNKAPSEQVETMDPVQYFAKVAEVLGKNPPKPADTAAVKNLRSSAWCRDRSSIPLRSQPTNARPWALA